MPSQKTSEAARDREVYKYFQPTELVPKNGTPHSSHDASMTAFAQLGALRLNARRVVISLVSRTTQHVVAEATQTISLRDDDVHGHLDELLYGVATVPRTNGICTYTMDMLLDNDPRTVLSNVRRNKDGSIAQIVVPDLRNDARFSGNSYVKDVRFYAAAPLLSPGGLIIGMYSVMDDKVREGLSDAEAVFLTDVASTVMDHLESRRVKQQQHRSEAMVKGMGLFVEGKASIRDWWLRTADSNQGRTQRKEYGCSLDSRANEHFGIQDPLLLGHLGQGLNLGEGAHQTTISSTAYGTSKRPRPPSPSSSYSGKISETSETVLLERQGIESLSPPISMHNVGAANEIPVGLQTERIDERSPGPPDAGLGAHLQEAMLSVDIKHVFARASNLVRESIAVDGVLYLDASIGTHGRNSKAFRMDHIAPRSGSHFSTVLKTSGSDEDRLTDATGSDGRTRPKKTPGKSEITKSCGILGFSTRTRSSLNMHESSRQHLDIPESFLQRLLKRYPHGKIFNFDEDGLVSSIEKDMRKVLNSTSIVADSDAESTISSSIRKKRGISREHEGTKFLEILPGARSIGFFPLWDSHKKRWFAGTLIWTTSTSRSLEQMEDLTYLAAFGNNIMAEVSRLEALVAAQMKHDFISSISHELRSPLHGVLAALEFLQDSDMDSMQIDMVNTVDACAKTLLDTINHILDFRKLNAHSTAKVRKVQLSDPPPLLTQQFHPALESTTSMVNISTLTEEVIQGVYAGHNYEKPPSSLHSSKLITITSDTVKIIIDIAWRENWQFLMDPGAWRRIVMNLFGNAMKYTEKGFIYVSLQSHEQKRTTNGPSQTYVTLSVRDTGKGMSKGFLQNHLFTPFAQENTLMPGTGLGLSIVRHIIDDLGGTVDFESEQGSGTTADVSLPCLKAKRQAQSLDDRLHDSLISVQPRTKGLIASLVGFDIYPDIVDEPTGILSLDAERMLSLRRSLINMITSWFRMEVVVTVTVPESPAKVILVTEQAYAKMRDEDFMVLPGQTKLQALQSPLIVVLSTTVPRSRASLRGRFSVAHFQQPLGPYKLASILNCWLDGLASQEPTPITKLAEYHSHSGQLKSRINPERFSLMSSQTPTVESLQIVHSDENKTTTEVVSTNQLMPTSEPLARWHRRNSVTYTPIPTNEADPSLPRTLLVEDNEINLRLLVAYMKKLGVPYMTAINGLEALTYYQEPAYHFDVIFMDISMPVMDGLASSRAIRRFETRTGMSPVTIIALTGAASPAARQEAFSSGIDRYLTKPVPMKSLKKILDELVIERRLRGKDLEVMRNEGQS